MNERVTVAGRQFLVDPVNGGFVAHGARGTPESFWALVRNGRWEPEVFAFLGKHLRPGSRFLDVGAWIGPFSLFAASLGARVLAVEPDPAAATRLLANRAANPDFDIELVSAALHPGVMPLRLFAEAFGDSETSVHPTRRRGSRDKRATGSLLVGTVRAAALLDQLGGAPDVLKIDIEGGEFAAEAELRELAGAARRAFALSLHPQNVYGASGVFDPEQGREAVRALLAGLPAAASVAWTAEKRRFEGTWPDLLSFAVAEGESLDTVFAAHDG